VISTNIVHHTLQAGPRLAESQDVHDLGPFGSAA
jgi:hypothetical protein